MNTVFINKPVYVIIIEVWGYEYSVCNMCTQGINAFGNQSFNNFISWKDARNSM